MQRGAWHPAYHHGPGYSTGQHLAQISNQPSSHPNGLGPQQTPFTQFAKPKLPENWYENQQSTSTPYPYSDYHSMMNQGTAGGYEMNQTHFGNVPPIDNQYSPEYYHMQGHVGPHQQNANFTNNPVMQLNHMDPNAAAMPKKPNNFLAQFQNGDGQIDVDKMLGTVGQLANTYHQVAPIIKQLGSFMKNFR